MSAASLATSTAVATEMPTSAVWSEGASLMPSPRKPTTWLRLFSARMIRVLLRGRDAGEDGRLLGHRRERAVGHALDLVATDDAGTVEADLTADVRGDKLVVAGEDLHHDAVAAEGAERLGDAFQRGIEEGHEAGEHELTLVAGRVHGLERHRRVGDGQDPGSLSAQLAVRRLAARPHRLIERGPATVDLVGRAAGDDALRGPLRDQQASAAVLDDDGEAAALEVERDLIDLPVSVDGDPAALENGRVQRTLDAGLVGAVDVGEGSGRSDAWPNGSRCRSSTISPLVSVPVLSLQRTSMLPKFWIAARCLTITFWRAMRTAPRERVTALIMGRNSGVRPTARATAKRSDSRNA